MSFDGDQSEEAFVVKLRGLPWSATVDEIVEFFRSCKIKGGNNGVHLIISKEGRPSGEAYIELEDEGDVERACSRDREHMGNRYIEVFRSNVSEMEFVVKRAENIFGNEDGCVRLRGLPFGCSKEEIAHFFSGLELMPNGITLLTDYSGRSCGEAYVQFISKEVAEKALQKHREKIGHRYIEIFRSNLSEVNSVLDNRMRLGGGGGGGGYRPSPYGRSGRYGGGGGGGMNRFSSRGSRSFKGNFSSGSDYNGSDNRPWKPSNSSMNGWSNGMHRTSGGGGMHCIHMRGLPFKASQMDIADFFKPITPVDIRLLQDNSGRASGEADVEFSCHEEAIRAMSKDKGHMQHRYIELFLNSSQSGGNNGNSGSPLGYGGIGRRRL